MIHNLIDEHAIKAGSSFQLRFQNRDPEIPDWVGFSGRGQLRDAFGGSLVESLTVTIVNAQSKIAEATLTAAQTTAITGETGVYDIEIYSGVEPVYRELEGTFEVTPEVTT